MEHGTYLATFFYTSRNFMAPKVNKWTKTTPQSSKTRLHIEKREGKEMVVGEILLTGRLVKRCIKPRGLVLHNLVFIKCSVHCFSPNLVFSLTLQKVSFLLCPRVIIGYPISCNWDKIDDCRTIFFLCLLTT